ncbi:C40 family peptidase [Priestia sp. OVS21]|nr:C40 family peptidase [Priestia sp. OVS21]MCJ7992704.1 C40 family peptidase [Priestia sp. OVS21]
MLADKIIFTGLQYLGIPYVFNAPSNQTNMFDCSSFIQYIFKVNGISLPRNSRQQFEIGLPISFSHIQKGICFFTTEKRKNRRGPSKIGHVGIYIGNGEMLHTYRPENKVTISKLNSYWKAVFVTAKRVI